eukprot:4445093-Pyramimonas_sp.AAC.1
MDLRSLCPTGSSEFFSTRMTNRRPIRVVCPLRCRTTPLSSITPDSSQVPLFRNRSHSVCNALRDPWFTAASALDAGRATAATLRGWLTAAGNVHACSTIQISPANGLYNYSASKLLFLDVMGEVIRKTAMAYGARYVAKRRPPGSKSGCSC